MIECKTAAQIVLRCGAQKHTDYAPSLYYRYLNLHPEANKPGNHYNGAMINEHGEEIPITENMIQDACQQLARCWQYPSQHKP